MQRPCFDEAVAIQRQHQVYNNDQDYKNDISRALDPRAIWRADKEQQIVPMMYRAREREREREGEREQAKKQEI